MINLLYCGNDKVFDGVLTSCLSVVRRLERPKPLTVYIFTMELTRVKPTYTPMTQDQAEALEGTLRRHNPETFVRLLDVTDLYETHLKENANEGCYCSPYTLLRLLADLVELPDKVLYLDADVMLCKDVSVLYDMDLKDYEYAAAPDHYGKFLIHPHYINAGVLLFNMELCRKNRIFEKARKLLREKKLVFADQSALIRSTTRRKVLPQRFNDQKFLHKRTVIRHFSKRLFYLPYPHTENVKQWNVEQVHKKFGYTCFDDIYEEYLEMKESSQWIV
ncbi:MAG: glycosyltransferase [Faecousia sp.]